MLHVLAQGGSIRAERRGAKIAAILCVTRDGAILTDCTLPVFKRLKRRGFVASARGGPYCITREGRLAVRAELDNRG